MSLLAFFPECQSNALCLYFARLQAYTQALWLPENTIQTGYVGRVF